MAYNPNAQKGISRVLSTGYQNGEIFTLLKSQPVCVNNTGHMVAIDPSIEALSLAIIGICSIDTPSAAYSQVMDIGRLEDITTSFSVGDPVFLGKDGFLTNIKPEIGVGSFVAGDFVIFIGVIVKNEFDVLKKDLKIFINIVGQL